jgi:UvrD-like helicase C-terminal domain
MSSVKPKNRFNDKETYLSREITYEIFTNQFLEEYIPELIDYIEFRANHVINIQGQKQKENAFKLTVNEQVPTLESLYHVGQSVRSVDYETKSRFVYPSVLNQDNFSNIPHVMFQKYKDIEYLSSIAYINKTESHSSVDWVLLKYTENLFKQNIDMEKEKKLNGKFKVDNQTKLKLYNISYCDVPTTYQYSFLFKEKSNQLSASLLWSKIKNNFAKIPKNDKYTTSETDEHLILFIRDALNVWMKNNHIYWLEELAAIGGKSKNDLKYHKSFYGLEGKYSL